MKVERMFPVLALLMNLAACLIIASCVRENRPPSDQIVNIGSHRLQVHLEGKGAPPVVIDAGIGDKLDKLRPLQGIICPSRMTYAGQGGNAAAIRRGQKAYSHRVEGRSASMVRTIVVYDSKHGSTRLAAE